MPTPIEENKSLVRRFIHAIERGEFAVFDEIVSPDYKRPSSRTAPGPREPQAVLRWGALSFPGLRVADHLHGRRGRQSRGADRVPGNP